MKKGKQKGGFWAQFQSSSSLPSESSSLPREPSGFVGSFYFRFSSLLRNFYFRLSNLFRNVYFRLFIFQVLVVSSVVFLLVFLIFNMFRNMEIRGIKTGFDFLGKTSGFGILFSLIDYSEASSYGRTYLVGLVNTIFVSLGGVVFATALGVTVGILRLSRNWLMRKLTTVYIETFRNLPILLQILFWNVVIKNVLPRGGTEGEPGYEKPWQISENIYVYIQGVFMPKLIPNELFFIMLFAFCLLVVFLVIFAKWGSRRLEKTGKTFPVFYTSLTIIAVFVASVYFLFNSMFTFENPVQGNFGWGGGTVFIPEIFVLVISLGVYTGTFIAEAVRSGIMAVDKGQKEAAASLGLKPGFILARIVMPQAMRVIIPPSINQYLNLTKNSSLAMAIGFPDLVAVFAGTTLNQVGQAIEIMLMTMFTYLALSTIVSLFLNWYNARVKLVER